MLWYLYTLIAGLDGPDCINLGFALLCFAQCFGLGIRMTAIAAAGLYLTLVVM